MRIWSSELGDFGTNCYILACEETGESAVIDPGAEDPWLRQTLTQHGLKPAWVLLTHGHLDHIGGIHLVKALTGAKVAVHGDDAAMLTDPRLNGSLLFGMPVQAPPPDLLLRDGDEIQVGNLCFTVIHTPGHTWGGIGLYYQPAQGPGHLFAGDTLFAGSIGRTDLPGGDHGTLINSIRTRLLTLPAETNVYPGHGPTTTIGDEAEYNPFLA